MSFKAPHPLDSAQGMPVCLLLLLAMALGAVGGVLEKRVGPTGSLKEPWGNEVWNHISGLGLGRVQYQGTNSPYYNDNCTQVITSSIDIYISPQWGATQYYYLAKGIKPNPDTLLVDESFSVPDVPSGSYQVFIWETQECQEPDIPAPAPFQAAAPYITINQGSNSRRSISTALNSRDPLMMDAAFPCGTLVTPNDTAVWDNTNGYGSATVVYNGIDQDVAPDNGTHITTYTLDLWLQGIDDPTRKYTLAKTIAAKTPTANGPVVDVSFQVPATLDGEYYLCVNETQEYMSGTTTALRTFLAASQTVSVVPKPSASSNTTSAPLGAIIGGIVGGVVVLLLIGLGIFFLLRRRHRQRLRAQDQQQPIWTHPSLLDATQGQTPLDPSFLPLPFDLSRSLTVAPPPEYTPSAHSSPMSTPSKPRFGSQPSTPDPARTSFTTSSGMGPGHSRMGSHARTVSSGTDFSTGDPAQLLLSNFNKEDLMAPFPGPSSPDRPAGVGGSGSQPLQLLATATGQVEGKHGAETAAVPHEPGTGLRVVNRASREFVQDGNAGR